MTVRLHRLERRQWLERPVDEVFDFFARADNLELITPSWLHFAVRGIEPAHMDQGTLIHYRLTLHGVPLRWTSRIEEWNPGRGFVDRQVRGPYRVWHHRHTFAAEGDGTLVRDEVHYALPLGRLGELAHRLFVRRDLERIFGYRHAAVLGWLGP
ncbi:MAG TPA: SRPBCC family protein [Solirubrobacteraceae bacterium]|nr:SRPBCC family protein [Solirubrobacteraceae bacterium]